MKPYLFSFLLCICSYMVLPQQNIYLQGSVTNSLSNQPLGGVKVVAVRVDNNKPLDSAYTNSNGFYMMSFLWTAINMEQAAGLTVIPNPAGGSAVIEAYHHKSGKGSFMLSQVCGDVVFSKEVELEAGENLITLTGGQAGTYLLSLRTGSQIRSARLLQVANTGKPFSVQVQQGGLPFRKSAAYGQPSTGDWVKLNFKKPGFYAADTIFMIASSQTINHTLAPFCKVNGTISGAPNSNLILGAKVKLIDAANGAVLDSTVTNETGYYALTANDAVMPGDFVIVAVKHPNTDPRNSYTAQDTTFMIQPAQTIDQKLLQIPYLFTLILQPFLDDGTPVTSVSPGWFTTLQFPDEPQGPGTKTYLPDGNNEVIIQEIFYPVNGDLGSVIIRHDTADYTVNGITNGVLSWMILRAQNQSTAIRNPAQSFLIYNGYTQITVFQDSLVTKLDSLDGRILNYYMLPKYTETQPGTIFRMDHGMVLGYMLSSGDGFQTSKFIEVPPYSHVVLMSTVYDNNYNQYASQTSLDRAINGYNKCVNLCNMANGDVIMQPTQLYYTNRNDSIWNAVLGRTPIADNVELLTYCQCSPANGRLYTNTLTYNGEARMYYSEAHYPEVVTEGVIFTENYSATFGIEEGYGSLGPYVYIATLGQPTDLAGRMARWVKLLDLGSGSSE